jgi:7-cyano-7-deazaguanine synthase
VTTCLLLSGGIDSMVVLNLLRQENRSTTAIFVDYGQGALDQERIASRQVAEHFGIELINLRIEFPRSYGAGEIRHRNSTLIFVAAMASADFADCIAIGVHAGVPYPDCSPAFIASMDAALKVSSSPAVQLIAPLVTWRKPEIIAYAKQERLPLPLTYSCEAGGTIPCGKCASCLDRIDI